MLEIHRLPDIVSQSAKKEEKTIYTGIVFFHCGAQTKTVQLQRGPLSFPIPDSCGTGPPSLDLLTCALTLPPERSTE